MTWPIAIPARKADRVAWVEAALACRLSWIDGMAAKYMSMEIGAKAVIAPSRITRPQGVGGDLAGWGRSVTAGVIASQSLADSPCLPRRRPVTVGKSLPTTPGGSQRARRPADDAARAVCR